ncbi:MAG: hypothetical protein GX804_10300 [Lentisphaerae bacterium]|nr:hypothetical protein [Lentisphaerota bacterium]
MNRFLTKERKSISVRIAVVLVCCVLITAVTVAETFSDKAQALEGLRMPLQRHSNGRVKTLFLADKVWMTDTGATAEGNIVLYMMAEDGTTNGIARAEKGDFNQKEDTALFYGPVFLEYDGNRVTGTILYRDSECQVVLQETNAVMTLRAGTF